MFILHTFSKSSSLPTLTRFGSYGLTSDYETLLLAKEKLLGGRSYLASEDRSGTLACLSVRFALEFNADEISCNIARTQVECHMQLCLSASEQLVTLAGSEPLLAEAATELMRQGYVNPVVHLASHPDLRCINRGRRGELVAALIIMQARDASALASKRRWVSVHNFMEALLPSYAFEELHKSMPTFWCANQKKTFSRTFEKYGMWFNHIIKVEDGEMIKAKTLWKFIMRGAMVMCSDNQYGVDIVLPICDTEGKLSRDTVTAILIQVRNVKCHTGSVVQWMFDAMNPFDVGLFPRAKGQSPLPVIRLVFALGSDEAGVVFPNPRRRRDLLTSFDIWCAGLSQNTFNIPGDDLESYRILLNRSRQPHDGFEAKETIDYPKFNDSTRAEKGLQRRRVAPLVMSQPGHDVHHTHSDDDGDGSNSDADRRAKRRKRNVISQPAD